MILKITGSALILLGAFLSFVRINKSVKLKQKQREDMGHLLMFLKSETEFHHSTLDMAFANIAMKMDEPLKLWLNNMSEEMKKNDKTFEDIWNEGITYVEECTYLGKYEVGILNDLGKSLGYLDIKQQMSGIELAIKLMEECANEGRAEIKDKIKMAISLCMLAGLFLIIVLI